MSKARLVAVASVFAAVCCFPPLAYAQATRTWVSGVGDDANPCSRTAPCKTFAGAISKTAIGGEVDALDPGGFGAVTITKSITIDGGSDFGKLVVAGTNAINISAAGSTVTLRNLFINGLNSGLQGISITSASFVVLENVVVTGFTQEAINVGSTSFVSIRDTIARASNFSVAVRPAPDGGAVVFLDNIRAEGNAMGVQAENGSTFVVFNNSTVTGNTTGLNAISGAALLSYGNNRFVGNSTLGGPISPITLQ